jgi:hypothetical protein
VPIWLQTEEMGKRSTSSRRRSSERRTQKSKRDNRKFRKWLAVAAGVVTTGVVVGVAMKANATTSSVNTKDDTNTNTKDDTPTTQRVQEFKESLRKLSCIQRYNNTHDTTQRIIPTLSLFKTQFFVDESPLFNFLEYVRTTKQDSNIYDNTYINKLRAVVNDICDRRSTMVYESAVNYIVNQIYTTYRAKYSDMYQI